MNILIIDNSIGITGALNAIIETIEPLRNKHNFRFVVPSGSATAQLIREKGYEVDELAFIEISRDMKRNLLYPLRLLGNALRLRKLVKRHNIDIIQVNDLYNLTALVAKRFIRVKVITHVRRMPESFPLPLYKWWVRRHNRRADKILPVSKANARIFEGSLKTEVFYDPLPPHTVSFTYRPEKKFKYHLLYLANFTIGKGQNHALEAMKIILKEYPDFPAHLHFTGSDFGMDKNREYREELEQTSRELGLSDRVSFHNGTADIVTPISQADIMLNFSDSESLSRVSMEALYFGVPLIATNVGGTNEMVIDGWNGILVRKADTKAMAKAIVHLVNDLPLRQQFSENGKIHVARHFSPDGLSLQLEKIYSSLA